MKEGTIVLLIAAVMIGFLVVFKFNTQVATGQRILTPQPSTNYGGYLRASTAPAVSGALNNLITGFGSAASAWLKGSAATPAQPPNPPAAASPTAAAAPVGPSGDALNSLTALRIQQSGFISGINTNSDPGGTLVGPQPDPSLIYDATDATAFDWSGMSAANAPAPSDIQLVSA